MRCFLVDLVVTRCLPAVMVFAITRYVFPGLVAKGYFHVLTIVITINNFND